MVFTRLPSPCKYFEELQSDFQLIYICIPHASSTKGQTSKLRQDSPLY